MFRGRATHTEVLQHDLPKGVVRPDLLVADEHGPREEGGRPPHDRVGVGGVEVDEHTLGQHERRHAGRMVEPREARALKGSDSGWG